MKLLKLLQLAFGLDHSFSIEKVEKHDRGHCCCRGQRAADIVGPGKHFIGIFSCTGIIGWTGDC